MAAREGRLRVRDGYARGGTGAQEKAGIKTECVDARRGRGEEREGEGRRGGGEEGRRGGEELYLAGDIGLKMTK